jgi:hypothetical protein
MTINRITLRIISQGQLEEDLIPDKAKNLRRKRKEYYTTKAQT